jgi:hypothetical protein
MPTVDNLILENYDAFVTENEETLFTDPTATVDVVADDSYYDMFKTRLLQGLDLEESELRKINEVLDRQRAMILEEANSLMSSPDAIAYAVASFPMIVNIYADPLLQKVASVFPTDKPTMSISRLRWVAKIIDEKGNIQEYMFPTATRMIRPDFKQFKVPTSDNLFTELGVAKGDFRISKRNFKVVSVDVKVDDGDSTKIVNVPIIALADARGNFAYDNLVVPDVDGGIYKVQGSVDFESGAITWALVVIEPGDKTVTADKLEIKFRIFGNGNGRGVVRAYPRQDIIDVNADIEDSFEVENIEEVIQDWKSLFNVNIIAELKDFVKHQMKLNRDFEIAEILESNIPYLQTINQYREVDLSQFVGDDFKAANVLDVFKNIIPAINALVEQMRRTTNMEVRTLVCGIDVAAILKSMQEFAIKFEKFEGNTGFKGSGVAEFNKLEIIESYAVSPDLIHLIVHSPTLSQATLVMITYKPLYVLMSVDNSIKRTYIKSRNWIGLVRSEGQGTIKLKNYEAFLSMGA